MTEQTQSFLRDLAQLCEKYDAEILPRHRGEVEIYVGDEKLVMNVINEIAIRRMLNPLH